MKILSINHQVKDDNARLLQLIKKDDKQAFAKIFGRYQATCYNAARAFLKSHELSRDAVEEIFLQVWLKRAEINDLRDFIFTTAKNVITTRLRELAKKYFEDQHTRTRMDAYWNNDKSK